MQPLLFRKIPSRLKLSHRQDLLAPGNCGVTSFTAACHGDVDLLPFLGGQSRINAD